MVGASAAGSSPGRASSAAQASPLTEAVLGVVRQAREALDSTSLDHIELARLYELRNDIAFQDPR